MKVSNKIHSGSLAFDVFNYTIMIIIALLCLLPIINVLSVSFSSSTAAAANAVSLWPVNFTVSSYKYALEKPQFLSAFFISVERVVLGVIINMLLTILAAYPLSKTKKELKFRNFYVWFFFFTMIFSGVLVPWYMVVKQTHLMNTIWSLIIPGAVPVFNVIILLNFFRQIPNELSESAVMDGAGHLTILMRIFLPLSIPSLATLILFVAVSHWNSWFDGLILMTDPKNYPLQTYLQTILSTTDVTDLTHATPEQLKILTQVSDRTLKDSQVFIAALPVLAVYPFLQRYFMKGLVLGSVKG